MSRIIAGAAKGRRLLVPKSGTRPTSDRVREAMFSSLESVVGSFTDLRVLDLYCGSGALGLEALSRGAAMALAVESARAAALTAQRNAHDLGLPLEVRIRAVTSVVSRPCTAPYDVVFADPPYEMGGVEVAEVLGHLKRNGWLAPAGVCVVERGVHSEPVDWDGTGLAVYDERGYGDTTLWYLSHPLTGEA